MDIIARKRGARRRHCLGTLDGPALRSKPLSVTPDTAPLQLTLEFAD